MDIVGKRGAQQQADIRVVRMPRVDCFVCARENPGCSADAQARVRRACGDAPTRAASIEAARRAGSNPRPPALPTRSPLGPRDARTRPRSEDVATRHGLTLERKAKKKKNVDTKKAGSKQNTVWQVENSFCQFPSVSLKRPTPTTGKLNPTRHAAGDEVRRYLYRYGGRAERWCCDVRIPIPPLFWRCRPLVSLGQTATRALLARARRKSESRDRERDCHKRSRAPAAGSQPNHSDATVSTSCGGPGRWAWPSPKERRRRRRRQRRPPGSRLCCTSCRRLRLHRKARASCLVVPVLLTTALVHARGGGLSRATGRAYCYHSEGQN